MSQDKVVIFDVTEVQPTGGRPTRARGDGTMSSVARAIEASADTVGNSLRGFLETVKGMLETVEDTKGDYQLDVVEVSAQVSADGKVGFMGVGMALKGASSMKIVFRRNA